MVSFPPLPRRHYGLIVIDPPWSYRSKGSQGAAEKHYSTVSTEDLQTLAVEDVAADDSLLLMWTTSSMLLEGSDTLLCKAWGFEPRSLHIWLKLTHLNQLHFGTGYYGHHCEEYFIVAVRGKPELAPFRSSKTVHAWAYPGTHDRALRMGLHAKGVHSRKPDEFYAWVESIYPSGRILELFARPDGISTRSDRWRLWGDQA